MWIFEVTDDGQQPVAMGDAPDRDTAIREASHYVAMYGQDGGNVKAIVREVPDDYELSNGGPNAKKPPPTPEDERRQVLRPGRSRPHSPRTVRGRPL